MTFKNDFFHSIRDRVRSISFFEFQFFLNNLKRASRFDETQILLKRIIYFNMSQYTSQNIRDIQTQNQTVSDVIMNNNKAFDLNLNYVNFEKKTKNSKTSFIRKILSSLLTHHKDKQKTFRAAKSNKKIIVNLTSNDIETYRCTFKNITRELIQKFNFVTKFFFFQICTRKSKKFIRNYKAIVNCISSHERNIT